MERSVPLRGFNLAIRLYLLLVAIFLPTFAVFYVYNMRIAEFLQAKEIDDVVQMSTFRMEDWLANRELIEMEESELENLRNHLKQIVDDPNGVEAVTVFLADGDKLRLLARQGPYSTLRPTVEDQNAFSQDRLIRMEVQQGENRFHSVSVPLRHRNEIRGAIHMEVSPDKVGARIPDRRTSLIIGAAGMMLVVGIGVVLFFHFAVRRPIGDLIRAMQHAAKGDFTTMVGSRTGEFGWLSTSFNQMMRQLKLGADENLSLVQQIQGFNNELKKRVELATEEVAAKNSQLQAANEKLFLIQRQMTTLEKLATLGHLATTIAHELGTPLNAISGHLQLMLQEPGVDSRILERLKVVDGQVDRLTAIIRDVLKAMRVPAPTFELVNINHVLEDVVDLTAPIFQKRGISIETKLSRDLPLLSADGDQLAQVFMNLFTNAIDAMKGGGGGHLTLATRYAQAANGASIGRESGCIQVDVTDSGEGMDSETVGRIFQPFFTTKGVDGETIANEGMGLGLGLSICRQIVKNHHGEISVKSERGKGTTFTLLLPVRRERVPAT